MKEKELRKASTCGVCGNLFGHAGLPIFWRIKIERFGVNMKAVVSQDGLAQMIGSSRLAQVMGTDADMTFPMMDPVKVTICEHCITGPVNIAALADKEQP